jgi:DNA-binding transcriptional ArsR family regulator
MWKSGNRVLRSGAKEVYQKIFRLRKEGKTAREIAEIVVVPEDLGDSQGYYLDKDKGRLTTRLMQTILSRNPRELTGNIEVEGKPVDSGLEAAIDETLLQEVKNTEFPNALKLQKKLGQDFRKQIMNLMPAFRWELEDRIDRSRTQIYFHVNLLKKAGALKERNDGLLQAEGKPFPKTDLWPKMRDGRQSKLRIKILESFPARQSITLIELSQKASISLPAAYYHMRSFEKRGVLIRDEHGKFRLSELGRKIKKELDQRISLDRTAE